MGRANAVVLILRSREQHESAVYLELFMRKDDNDFVLLSEQKTATKFDFFTSMTGV